MKSALASLIYVRVCAFFLRVCVCVCVCKSEKRPYLYPTSTHRRHSIISPSSSPSSRFHKGARVLTQGEACLRLPTTRHPYSPIIIIVIIASVCESVKAIARLEGTVSIERNTTASWHTRSALTMVIRILWAHGYLNSQMCVYECMYEYVWPCT